MYEYVCECVHVYICVCACVCVCYLCNTSKATKVFNIPGQMVVPGGLIALVFILCFIDLNSINFIIEISGK